MIEVAIERFADEPFKRRRLMDETEAEVRRRQLWELDDDRLSGSVGTKSRGLAAIDYRLSDLAARGTLISTQRGTWRINPTALESKQNMTRKQARDKPADIVHTIPQRPEDVMRAHGL